MAIAGSRCIYGRRVTTAPMLRSRRPRSRVDDAPWVPAARISSRSRDAASRDAARSLDDARVLTLARSELGGLVRRTPGAPSRWQVRARLGSGDIAWRDDDAIGTASRAIVDAWADAARRSGLIPNSAAIPGLRALIAPRAGAPRRPLETLPEWAEPVRRRLGEPST